MEENKTKKSRKLKNLIKLLKKKRLYVIIAAAVLLVLLITLFIAVNVSKAKSENEPEPKVVTEASLEKIINVSELSTFMVVYNGIASVRDEAKPEKISYYVSYEAKVKVGINTEDVVIKVDNDAKKISVTLPEVHITDSNVDHSSLDFMFVDDKANISAVTEKAFKTCEDDVRKECKKQSSIFELAAQNAENIVKALIKPIIQVYDYELSFENE